MQLDSTTILKALGPAASIIFAAWIFMGFLQARSDAAAERFHQLVMQYRSSDMQADHRANAKEQILVYKRRCHLMNVASVVGLFSAMILILSLVAGELAIIFKGAKFLMTVSALAALVGLLLVVAASAIVLAESLVIHRQLQSEVLDVPDLAEGIGEIPGTITDPDRVQRRHGARS